MKQNLFTDLRKNRVLRMFVVSLSALALFYAAVCTPVYLWASSDILIANSFFTLIWDVLMSVCQYLFYWIALSFLLFFFLRFDSKSNKTVWLFCGIICASRYFLNHLAGCFVTGFQSINDFFTDFLPYILLDIVLDFVLIGLSLLIIHMSLKKNIQQDRERRDVLLNKHLPITKLLDRQNPLSRAVASAALIPSAFKLVSRLIYDFSIGAPVGLADLLWIITFYIFDILSFFIGYVVMLLLINKMHFSELKAKSEFDM